MAIRRAETERPDELIIPDELSAILDRTSALAGQYHIASLGPLLEACRGLLSRDSVLEVAVFGRFKAGKSSFLNALAGAEILPVGVLPVTSVITRLRYGPRPEAEVRFLSGASTKIKPEEVGRFISEAENPRNHKQVMAVELRLPSLAPYLGLEFIDTPGLGSVHHHNTQVSLDWLPYAGAVLVVISVDNPLAEDDAAFIEELRRYTPRLVILLTKADRLDELELAEVREFARRELERRFKADFLIYPFSSRLGTAKADQDQAREWKEALDRELLQPLAAGSAWENRRLLYHKMETLLQAAGGYLEVALRASTKSDAELAGLRAYILEENNSFDVLADELQLLTQRARSRTYSLFEETLQARTEAVESLLTDRLRQQLPRWKMNLWRLTRAYEEWLKINMTEELNGISLDHQDVFLSPLRAVEKSVSRLLETFRDRLAWRIEERLGVKIPQVDHGVKVSEPGRPDVSFGRAFDSHLDNLWFLIPMGLFRSFFHRHFLRQLRWEVEKNLSRLATQWSDSVTQAITDLETRAKEYVRSQIATVENILDRKVSGTSDLSQALKDLSGMKAKLAALSAADPEMKRERRENAVGSGQIMGTGV
ncbi:MAG: dynamin family protein [Thermodesulfobacteriota bacterium]